ncbi:MAG: UDP-N-acetylglucosamine 1-carboxyvinyltransferase [Oscillospiraceae bacterium]|nr:UDP-N-acetylglucosamine 1-carboxyvinyltransferase [Oscillospiraceae bacterium]
MEIWHVRGGNRLFGSCRVQGSKNASLPVLAASMVLPARSQIRNVPQLRDVDAAASILSHLGCRVERSEGEICIDSTGVNCAEVPHELMAEMRSSVIFMGALLGRCGEAKLSLPGGCQLGKRPIDLHLSALRAMGAQIDEEGRDLFCRAERLHGADITLRFPSVGATENIMLAACAAEGRTTIRGAAREPEIVALQDYLTSLGAHIAGAGSDTVVICGVSPRPEADFTVPGDRIVASTLACACAAAGGRIILSGVKPDHFLTVLHFLNEAGCDIIHVNDIVEISSSGSLRAPGSIVTAPYPGFPTDAQPILMAALLRAEGTTQITETIFENRYRQVSELRRLGADIRVKDTTALVRGVKELHGETLTAPDLRGGAAMIVAALSARGESRVIDAGHIKRGYENLDDRLCALGAEVWIEHT